MIGPDKIRLKLNLILLVISLVLITSTIIGLSHGGKNDLLCMQLGDITLDLFNLDLGILDDLRSALAEIINKLLGVPDMDNPIVLNESEINDIKKTSYSILVYTNGTRILVEDAKGNIISNRPSGSDDAIAIKEAINIINRGTILCVGSFKINSPIDNLKENIRLAGMPGKAIFNCADMKTDVFLCGGSGYVASTNPLVDDVTKGSRTIKVIDANDYKEGDFVKLIDNENIIGFKKGEILKIEEINSTEIIFEKGIQDNYTVGNAANIRKLIMTEGIIIDGIKFIGPGIETDMSLFRLALQRNFRFINNEVSDFGRAAVYLSDSLDATIENNLFENIYMTGFGYSIAVTNACDNVLIKNNLFQIKGRHYITFGAGTGTRISGGFSRNIRVVDNIFENCAQEAINSHPPFIGPIEIVGNRFVSCGKGIEISNGNTVIVDNIFIDCPIGIQLLGEETRLHNIYSNEFIDSPNEILIETRGEKYYLENYNGHFLISGDDIEFL